MGLVRPTVTHLCHPFFCLQSESRVAWFITLQFTISNALRTQSNQRSVICGSAQAGASRQAAQKKRCITAANVGQCRIACVSFVPKALFAACRTPLSQFS